jgi:AcrR family transcriptional regulator
MQETLDRKNQLKEVAQSLFKEKGYVGASMRDMAQTLGIEAPSIYNHISSKQELLSKICFDIASQYSEIIVNIKRSGYNHPGLILQTIIEEHVKIVISNIEAAAVFHNEWRFLEDPDHSRFLEMRCEYEDFIESVIKEGVSNAVFKTNNTKLCTLSLLSALNGIYHWYSANGSLNARDISHNILNLFFLGLKR